MPTITIDNSTYLQAQQYARRRNISVDKFVEETIADIVRTKPHEPKDNVPYMETEEFQKALEYMDTLTADDLTSPVPADENGLDALIEAKYAG